MGHQFAPLEAVQLSKHYRGISVVDALDFTIRPGVVTGFLGPNGAGKTTTIRMLLGLITPTAGSASICGRAYVDLPDPARTVGAVLDGAAAHPSHTGLGHLRTLAPFAGVDDRRCRELLTKVGLESVAGRRVGGYSFGMRQRLTLAASLLGDPQVLILDEPTLGLDPQGIRWLWDLLSHLADEGRTVLVSSHSLSELQEVVDDVLIIARGKLRYHGPLADLATSGDVTIVRTPEPARLLALAAEHRWHAAQGSDTIEISGVDQETVGALLHREGLAIYGLESRTSSLTDSYFEMTGADQPDRTGAA